MAMSATPATLLSSASGSNPRANLFRHETPAEVHEAIAASAPETEAGQALPSILLAEDHIDSREALRVLLEASGYRVHLAGTGREAVEIALSVRPDLILMDAMMPEMDGFQATRILRSSSGFRQVPIVAVTAMEGAKLLAEAAGCNEVIHKPIQIRPFLERVRAWLQEDSSAAA
jgi:CheY-like chemotaxis protein